MSTCAQYTRGVYDIVGWAWASAHAKQLYAHDCHQNPTELQATEYHTKKYTHVQHWNCQSGLAIIYNHTGWSSTHCRLRGTMMLVNAKMKHSTHLFQH